MPKIYSKLTEEEKRFIVNNYLKLGPAEISRKIKRSYESIERVRKKFNIPKLSKKEISQHKSIAQTLTPEEMKVSILPFQKIETPEIAYILGLLWADGHIPKRNGEIIIAALKQDILEYKPTFLSTGKWVINQGNYKVHGQESNDKYMKIYCCNTQLANYLHSVGYISKSSESACKILSLIPNYLKHYWFRGLFDGDGCLLNPETYATYNLCICSSYEQDWTYIENLFKELNISYKINRKIGKKHKGSTIHIFNKRGIKYFFEYIYKNKEIDNIGLSRKYKLWLKFIEMVIKRESKNCSSGDRIYIPREIKNKQ